MPPPAEGLDPGEHDLGDGLTFRRLSDGHVLVRLYLTPGDYRRVLREVRVSAADWAALQLALLPTPLPKGIAPCEPSDT